jgi:hypothetical protein
MVLVEITIPHPLSDLMQDCETFCVASCCDIDAFDFGPENTEKWISRVGLEAASQAKDQLVSLIKEVQHRKEDIYVHPFGHINDKHTLLERLNELEKAIQESLA